MFKFKHLAASAFLLLAAVTASSVAAQAENQAYLPLAKAEPGQPFPLKHIASISIGTEFERTAEAGAKTAKVKLSEEGDLLLTGQDRAGKDWSVMLTSLCAGGAEAYMADLDRNGLRDLVLLVPTCGNGFAPSSHIVTVTFESNNRPLRFEVEGYFDSDRKSIFDVCDINGDKRAELLYMNFDDGYWIMNLYTVSEARWRRVKGQFGGRSYPLYTRFTNRSNRRATKPLPGRHPFAPDLSHDAPHLRGQLRSYRWTNVSQSEDVELNFETSQGRQIKYQPVS